MPELILFLFPLAYSPGPGNLFFAATGARFGLRAAVPALAGYHVATFAVTLAIGLGFDGLLRLMPVLAPVLRVAGAAYLLWLALGMLRAGFSATTRQGNPAGWSAGALLLLLNPKAYVIMTLMFARFLPQATGPAPVLWISALFTLNNLVAFVLWAAAGDVLLRPLQTARNARRMNLVFGALLAGVALWLLIPG
ncbi:LysE family translocator [Actibacterium ureilyticum]|uniref:LysE family translocator n=1 Tax=Actibacterium ureilyticum TaxID=1590614 RepID=UPI000BAAF864|nr:LysE family translocator [Actibacterium ureilyticum]